MNIDEFIRNNGLVSVPNPNYNPRSKKNKQPQYLQVPDDGTMDTENVMANDMAESYKDTFIMPYSMTKKYHDYGISYNRISTNLDRDLVNAQSNLAKIRNSIAQTLIGELLLGTAKAFTDLGGSVVDVVSGRMFESDYDFSNPVSAAIGEAQEKFNNEVVPIYADESKDISNGGLLNWGWWAKNIPTLASTLTLLIPSKAVSFVGGKIVNGIREAATLRKAARLEQAVKRGESIADATRITAASGHAAKELSFLEKLRYDPKLQESLKVGGKITAEALMMRTIENYQEGQQSYSPVYTEALNNLENMNPDEYAQFIADNKDEFKNVDTNDKDAVAKAIAHNAAAKTFAMDYANTIWDVIQLYGLRNIGKVKTSVNSRTIQQAQRQAIATATKTPVERISQGAVKDILHTHGARVADFLKGSWKTILSESTEGIEEIVNYIAQQEGLTYGKALFDKTIDTSLNGTYNRFLQDYMDDPAMWESGFWGVLGGVVFAGGGNLINNYIANKERAKQKKKRTEQNETTGEVVNASGADFIELLERPEVAAAKEAILARNAALAACSDKLAAIDQKKNPFDIDSDTGEYKDFSTDNGDIELQQNLAKMQVMKEYRQKLTLDAINSGTYDLLLDYVKADNVKKAMVEYGLADENNVDTIAEATVADIEKTKKEYFSQLTKVNAAITQINKQNKGKAAIPFQYVQRIANSNTNRQLQLDAMDEQISALQKKIQDELPADKQMEGSEYQTLLEYLKLHDLYGRLEADKRRIQDGVVKDNEGNPLDAWMAARQISDINAKQTAILNQIKNSNLNITGEVNADAAKRNLVGALLHTIKVGGAYRYDEARGYGIDSTAESYRAKDEDIIKQYKQWFEGTEISVNTIGQLSDIVKNRADYFVDLDTKLRNEHPGLRETFNQLTTLNVQRAYKASEIANTVEEVANLVDTYHNIDNKVRDKLIQDANTTVLSLLGKYYEDTPDGKQDIEEVIIQAYFENKDEAYRLAREKFTGTNERGESDAENLISALNIINFSNGANQDVYDYLMYMIGFAKQRYKTTGQMNLGRTEVAYDAATENANRAEFSRKFSAVCPTDFATYNTNSDEPLACSISTQDNTVDTLFIDAIGTTEVAIVRVAGTNDTFTILNQPEVLAKVANMPYINSIEGSITEPGKVYSMVSPLKIKIVGNKLKVIQKANLKVVDAGTTQLLPDIAAKPTPPPASAAGTSGAAAGSAGAAAGTTGGSAAGSAGSAGTADDDEVVVVPGTSPTGEEDAATVAKKEVVADAVFAQVTPSITRGEAVNWDNVKATATSKVIADCKIPAENTSARTEVSTLVDACIAEIRNSFDALAANRVRTISADDANHDETNADAISNAAEEVALFSRWHDPSVDVFGDAFKDSIKAIVDAYSARLVLPEVVDGGVTKKVVTIRGIMESIYQVATSTNDALTKSILSLVSNYLATPEAKRNYVVIDYEEVENGTLLANLGKHDAGLAMQSMGTVEIPIDLSLGSLTNPGFGKTFATLKPNDVLDVRYAPDSNMFLYEKDGVLIGHSGIPKFANGRYLQYNRGWRTDVALDASGNPVSDAMDLLIDIFTNERGRGLGKWNNVLSIIYRFKANQIGFLDAVQLFEQDAEIQKLATDSKNAPMYDNLFFVNAKTNSIDFRPIFAYLIDISSRFASPSAISQQAYINMVVTNMQNWFLKLHKTYQAIDNLNLQAATKLQVTVADIFEGSDNTITKNPYANYASLKYPDEGLTNENLQNCEIAWTSNGVTRTTSNSDPTKEVSSQIAQNRGAYVKIYRKNGKPVYISALGTQLETAYNRTSKQTLMDKMLNAVIGRLKDIVTSTQGSVEDRYNECVNWFIYTIAMNNNNQSPLSGYADKVQGVVPLFRRHTPNQPFIGANRTVSRNGYQGTEILLKMANGTYTNIKIYKTNKDGGPKFEFNIKLGNKESYTGAAAVDIMKKLLIANFAANIDENGIGIDNGRTDAKNGFLTKNDTTGKVVLNIQTGSDSTSINEEFDSYKDYLIQGRLIKVNAEIKDGSNFSTSSNGAPNASLSVSLPQVVSANPVKQIGDKKIYSDYRRSDVNIERYEKVKAVLEKRVKQGSNPDGTFLEELFEAIGRGTFYRELQAVCDELGIDVPLFPTNVVYHAELNAVEVDSTGKNVLYGPIASTNPDDKIDRTFRIRRDGKSITQRLKKGWTVVGAEWLNHIASNDANKANLGIRTLMHERLHDILHTKFSEEELKAILNDARGLKEELLRVVKDIKDTGDVTNYKDITVEQATYIYKVLTAPRNPDVAVEEFIVEALTSRSFFNVMNSIDYTVTEDGRTKRENLFTKFIELIRRIFGFGSVKDNTLYAEFLNVLQTVSTDNVSEEAGTTEEQIAVPTPVEDIDADDSTSDESNDSEITADDFDNTDDDATDDDIISAFEQSDETADNTEGGIITAAGNEDIATDGEYSASDFCSIASEENVGVTTEYDERGLQHDGYNVPDDLRCQLPIEDEETFNQLLSNGYITYKCRI